MTVKTTYTDKNGKTNTGYIVDGRTYTDAEGNNRVPVGSTVNTAGGTFRMTDSGGVPTQSTIRNTFTNGAMAAETEYKNSANGYMDAYKGASAARVNAIDSAVKAALRETEYGKAAASRAYEDANRGAYENYLAAANPYGAAGEQRAKLGLDNSGFAESSQIKLANAYQGELGNNVRARDDSIQKLELAAMQARANGEYEKAAALEASAQTMLNVGLQVEGNAFDARRDAQDTLLSSDQNALAAAYAAEQFNEQMAADAAARAESTRQFNAKLAASEREQKIELAMKWLAQGLNPSFAAEALGIPQSDINALAAAVRAANAPKVSSSGGSKKSTGGSAKESTEENTEESTNDDAKTDDDAKQSSKSAVFIYEQIRKYGEGAIEWLQKYGKPYGISNEDFQKWGEGYEDYMKQRARDYKKIQKNASVLNSVPRAANMIKYIF